MNDMTLGQVIKDARLKLRYGLRPVAQKLGLSPGYICQIEYDKCSPPKASTLIKIAEFLKIDTDFLLSKAGKIPADIIAGLLEFPDAIPYLRGSFKVERTKKTQIKGE